jgi:hypothetical protein
MLVNRTRVNRSGTAIRTFLASVAVHVRLQRAWAGEALVADLALVLLLRTRRDLGAELTHHGLRSGGDVGPDQRIRSRQGSVEVD